MSNVNPTTVITAPEFSPTAKYEFAVAPAGADLNVAPAGTEIASLSDQDEVIQALDLIPAGLAPGSYVLQYRASEGLFFTQWSVPQTITWDNVLPGVPGPVTFS